MARYLVTQDSTILDMVEAKSMREAVDSLGVTGDGEFQVYTVTGLRTVGFETVQETRLTFGTDTPDLQDEDDESEE